MSTIQNALTTPPLTVPNKNFDQFDWISHMKYILNEAQVPLDQFTAEIHELNHMRNRCLGAGADKVGLQLYGKYYQQTVQITNRFIMVDVPEGLPGFKWSDAYDSTFQMDQNSLAFEKANILFNSAAILSQQGAAFPTATADDLNGVFNSFQASASILHYIKEHFLHPPLHDISKPSLEFLCQLMQAQAQEAAAKKAVLLNTASSAKIQARLWQSSAVHFSTALKFWYAPNAAKLRENVQESVPHLIDQKYRLSTAFALYFAAQWSYAEERVGEAIARCMAARKMCEEAGPDGVLSRQFTVLRDEIVREYVEKLEKENGLIFHDPVPAVIPEIEPASLITIQSVEQVLNCERDRDLFAKAIPKHLRFAMEKFKEEADKLFKYEKHLVDTVKTEIQKTNHELDSVHLFGSPKKYLFERLEEVIRREAALILKGEHCSELHGRTVRLKEILRSEVSLILENLQATNRQLFDIPQISVDERRELLEKADTLAAMFESTNQQLSEVEIPEFEGQLAKMEERVKEYAEGKFEDTVMDNMPCGDDDDDDSASSEEKKVVMDKSSMFKAEEALQKLDDMVKSEDITDELVKAGQIKFDQVIEKSMKKFDPLAAAVEDAVDLAKQEIARLGQYLEDKKSRAQTNAAFKYAEEQVEKRKTLIAVYRGEISKIRDAFEILHTIKSEDLDSAREEYKKLEDNIKQKRASHTIHASDPPSSHPTSSESQAVKDREYMLSRLRQLGITPDRQ